MLRNRRHGNVPAVTLHSMSPAHPSTGAKSVRETRLLAECHARAVALLKRNLTPAGILAALPTARADKRGYTAIFGRDAAVCALGMAVSGDAELERAAVVGLHTLDRKSVV